MIVEIPLEAGRAYQRFSVTLSGRLLTLRLRWLEQYAFYAVDITEAGEPITLGRGLHPDMNLLHGLNSGLGRLYLDGQAPSIDNLGKRNRLLYDDEAL